MSNKELREKATMELAKALSSVHCALDGIEKATRYMNLMDAEIKALQEIAADVDEMIG